MRLMRKKFSIKLVQLPIPEVLHLYTEGNIPLAAGYLKAFAIEKGVAEAKDIEILPQLWGRCSSFKVAAARRDGCCGIYFLYVEYRP